MKNQNTSEVTLQELKNANKYLSVDSEDTIEKQVESIKAFQSLGFDENSLIDNIAGVYPAEAFEYSFTIKTFLDLIKD